MIYCRDSFNVSIAYGTVSYALLDEEYLISIKLCHVNELVDVGLV
jgi:hypothetical protein